MTHLSLRRTFLPVVLAALGLSAFAAGCGEDGLNPAGDICCDDFKVGADLTGADFGVDADNQGQFEVFAQAVGDLSATATATLNDIELSCRNIAIDLGAAKAQQDAADLKTGTARMQEWCKLATAQISANFGANGTLGGELVINYQPPVCEASFSAKADCQAKCSGSAQCDIKANPPTCEGGQLEVECAGECSVSGSATISCEGQCTGMCQGSCTTKGGVRASCDGTCEGKCSADASGGGNGGQADGSCKGFCEGTCRARAEAPAIACEGTCEGQCSASCKAQGQVAAKCSGTCSVEATPLRCKGGTLKGGCTVEASCDANCEASVSAKAECRPPELNISAQVKGNLDVTGQARFDAAIESLRVNLPSIAVAVKARGTAFATAIQGSVDAGIKVVADPGKLGLKGVACVGAITGAATAATGNFTASIQAAASVSTAAGLLSAPRPGPGHRLPRRHGAARGHPGPPPRLPMFPPPGRSVA
ncbi:MAG TPA: hypothetical protein VFS00_09450, partial [Polyangiaceae bacterium]|nr:hypothetical protein [Polyangiaceae bacterium]